MIDVAEALYRKYRPQVFADMVGQEHIERTLKNAIEQDKLSHAYLFCGPRGTGKTTTSRLLAKALLCQNAPTAQPDGTCEDCQLVAKGEHPDVYELDAASRTGVENVREEIINRVQFAPTRGARKIYIIDEVHMLSLAAFNALLKTLEEPPSHVLFILCTTDPQKVPETIHSRCQRFDFRSINSDSVVARLGAICTAEGVTFEGQALELIAHRAEGGMRNALTALEQLITFGGGAVTLAAAEEMLGSLSTSEMAEIMAAIGQRNAASCFEWTAKFVETGADLGAFVKDMAEHVRNLYVLSLAGQNAPVEVSEATRKEMADQLQWFGSDRLARMLGVLGGLMVDLRQSTNARLSFEIACTRLVRPESDLTLEALAERIEQLERGGFALTMAAGVAERPAGGVTQGQPARAASGQAAAAGQGAAAVAMQAAAATRDQGERSGYARPQAAQGQPAQGGGAAGQRGGYAQAAQAQPAASQAQAYAAQPVAAAQTRAAQPAQQAHQAAQPAAAQDGAQPAVQGGAAKPADAALLQRLSNPASLQRSWQAVVSALKRIKQAYGALFVNTRAALDPNGSLRVEFPAGSDFAFRTVSKPEVAGYVAEAIRQGLGADVPFTLVLQTGGGMARVQPMDAAQAQAGYAQQGVVQQRSASAQTRQAQPAARQSQPAGSQVAASSASAGHAATSAASAAAQAQPAAQQAATPRNPQDVPPWEDVPAQRAAAGVQAAATQQRGAAQQSAAAASQPAPYDDQVPLDAYDDVVPYDDEGWDAPPFDDAPAAGGMGGLAAGGGAEPAAISPAAAERAATTDQPAEDPAAWQANLCQAFGPLQFNAVER